MARLADIGHVSEFGEVQKSINNGEACEDCELARLSSIAKLERPARL